MAVVRLTQSYPYTLTGSVIAINIGIVDNFFQITFFAINCISLERANFCIPTIPYLLDDVSPCEYHAILKIKIKTIGNVRE